jgi:hypothetical protein
MLTPSVESSAICQISASARFILGKMLAVVESKLRLVPNGTATPFVSNLNPQFKYDGSKLILSTPRPSMYVSGYCATAVEGIAVTVKAIASTQTAEVQIFFQVFFMVGGNLNKSGRSTKSTSREGSTGADAAAVC